MTKNDIAWALLFRNYDILSFIHNDGFFRITAAQINEYREARLMTKFDHKSNLPKLFIDNHLSILPVTRGDYIIASMKTYKELDIDEECDIQFIELPANLQSLDPDDIRSEAAAISCAYASGILEHFLGEEIIPTVNGRMSAESFSFKVQNSIDNSIIEIDVKNSQIEIDGGFESLNSLCLIEAKNSISTDFLLRQLYYPYRLWTQKIVKPVRLVFMIYTNGIFNLFEYSFENLYEINSITLIRRGRYSLEQNEITIDDLSNIQKSISIVPEPDVPFPQADSFERVINLCELLYENDLTKDEITTTYDFDPRQTDYYSNAGKYLGLIEAFDEDERGCRLTQAGRDLFMLKFKDRQLKLTELILKHFVFSETLSLYFQRAEEPSRDEVVVIMKSARLYNVNSLNTYKRRASTVMSWVNWIIDLIA